ncbi:hypothetical protein [Pseudorhodoferax sp.]|uniref:hypothetical protein n=1 Tax=Pseudorhodoferax sp. TaxID=1993553 RepID=UPI0039E292F8
MLTELMALLTCDELDVDELAALVARIEAAPDDPELAFVEGETPAEYMQIAVIREDFVMMSDRVDELHEQVSEQFAEPLPVFPNHRMPAPDYFRWLDEHLAGGKMPYELLLWGNPYDYDNLNAIVVRRADTERILAIAAELGLLVERAAQRRLT